mmetsp:Transcript_27993/g.68453  ORF Transcript_27993/g.68453 Transcript_27993/m.68453 type:complete len:224 (-) Transcript_27993:1710-2381(-)
MISLSLFVSTRMIPMSSASGRILICSRWEPYVVSLSLKSSSDTSPASAPVRSSSASSCSLSDTMSLNSSKVLRYCPHLTNASSTASLRLETRFWYSSSFVTMSATVLPSVVSVSASYSSVNCSSSSWLRRRMLPEMVSTNPPTMLSSSVSKSFAAGTKHRSPCASIISVRKMALLTGLPCAFAFSLAFLSASVSSIREGSIWRYPSSSDTLSTTIECRVLNIM